MNFPNSPDDSGHWPGLEFIGISNASIYPTSMKANKKTLNFFLFLKTNTFLLSKTPDIK